MIHSGFDSLGIYSRRFQELDALGQTQPSQITIPVGRLNYEG